MNYKNREDLIELKRQGFGNKKIGELFGVKKASVQYWCNKFEISETALGSTYRKWSINHHYFDDIQTEEQSYILGFIAADGHVRKEGIVIALHPKDIDILEKIKLELESNIPIRIRSNSQGYGNNDIALLNLNSRILSKRLRELGFSSKKTYDFQYPNYLLPNLHKHFIRGYWDGDGSIMPEKNIAISATGTQDLLLGIREQFSNITIKRGYLYQDFNRHHCSLTYGGRNVCRDILQWLYSDSSIYLDRKYSLFLRCIGG